MPPEELIFGGSRSRVRLNFNYKETTAAPGRAHPD